jgi:hypothetical protein
MDCFDESEGSLVIGEGRDVAIIISREALGDGCRLAHADLEE